MLRAVLVLFACVTLGGCWVSEQGLFGSADWARPDIAGEYEIESPTDFGGPGRRVTIASRADGLFEIVSQGWGDRGEDLVMGLVPIPRGSGRFYLVVDLSTSNEDATFYYIARLAPGGDLALYYPDCSGTSPRDGLEIDEGGKGGPFCGFSSREALLGAALEAERFLAAKHIVAVQPMYSLNRVEFEANPDDFEPE